MESNTFVPVVSGGYELIERLSPQMRNPRVQAVHHVLLELMSTPSASLDVERVIGIYERFWLTDLCDFRAEAMWVILDLLGSAQQEAIAEIRRHSNGDTAARLVAVNRLRRISLAIGRVTRTLGADEVTQN